MKKKISYSLLHFSKGIKTKSKRAAEEKGKKKKKKEEWDCKVENGNRNVNKTVFTNYAPIIVLSFLAFSTSHFSAFLKRELCSCRHQPIF